MARQAIPMMDQITNPIPTSGQNALPSIAWWPNTICCSVRTQRFQTNRTIPKLTDAATIIPAANSIRRAVVGTMEGSQDGNLNGNGTAFPWKDHRAAPATNQLT